MEFKTEKLLIRIAAVLGAIGIVLVAILYFSVDILKTMPEMQDALEEAGHNLEANYLTTTYYILTILSILDVVALFIIASKLSLDNYKIMGIILIILGILSYWLLWFVPIILMVVAGVLLLTKRRNHQISTNVGE